MGEQLDRWVSAEIREQIEQRFYAKVNQQATFEQLLHDPAFMEQPQNHVALFDDHGVVHMRDIALQVLNVLRAAHGLLIPQRSALQFDTMCGYGVLITYFHDIGMINFSAFGRAMHPEFAAQMLFDPSLDALIDQIWRENSGGLAWRLSDLAKQGILAVDPRIVLREMLALSLAHSKSKVPVTTLNDPHLLRDTVQAAIQQDLYYSYLLQNVAKAKKPSNPHAFTNPNQLAAIAGAETAMASYAGPQINPNAGKFYADFEAESFAWLTAAHPHLQELVLNVTDTLRALRSADALRQRGTTLKTSGNYEIFVDRRTGNAVFALRHGDDKLLLLETTEPISSGEANIAASELTESGELRIGFHRGSFTEPGAIAFAAHSAAIVIFDMQKDVIESFIRPPGDAARLGLKSAESMTILLEETEDNPEFVQQVQRKMTEFDPVAGARIAIVPSLKNSAESERQRYLAGKPVDWSLEERTALLQKMAQSGHQIDAIDVNRAFEHVKLIHVEAKDVLIDAGAPSTFVYIPLSEGLRIIPLGSYQAFVVQPWMPLGLTGVIRGAERNADVVAEQALHLLMIPGTIYLRHWHQTHTPESFKQTIARLLLTDEG